VTKRQFFKLLDDGRLAHPMGRPFVDFENPVPDGLPCGVFVSWKVVRPGTFDPEHSTWLYRPRWDFNCRKMERELNRFRRWYSEWFERQVWEVTLVMPGFTSQRVRAKLLRVEDGCAVVKGYVLDEVRYSLGNGRLVDKECNWDLWRISEEDRGRIRRQVGNGA